jgi:hypothetical protein
VKLRILDITFRVKEIGFEGNEKPKKAQTLKTANIGAKKNRVNFVT